MGEKRCPDCHNVIEDWMNGVCRTCNRYDPILGKDKEIRPRNHGSGLPGDPPPTNFNNPQSVGMRPWGKPQKTNRPENLNDEKVGSEPQNRTKPGDQDESQSKKGDNQALEVKFPESLKSKGRKPRTRPQSHFRWAKKQQTRNQTRKKSRLLKKKTDSPQSEGSGSLLSRIEKGIINANEGKQAETHQSTPELEPIEEITAELNWPASEDSVPLLLLRVYGKPTNIGEILKQYGFSQEFLFALTEDEEWRQNYYKNIVIVLCQSLWSRFSLNELRAFFVKNSLMEHSFFGWRSLSSNEIEKIRSAKGGELILGYLRSPLGKQYLEQLVVSEVVKGLIVDWQHGSKNEEN